MSDSDLDALAEMARNRGLRLVRSRVRTPGKRRFGKVGLTDKAGKALLGMDAKGPTAKPEEVEGYLRDFGAGDWGASLDVPVVPRSKKAKRQPTKDSVREAKRCPPPPRPKPKPAVREARASDAGRLVALIQQLGHELTEKQVRDNLTALKKAGETPLVATLDNEAVGLVGMHRMVTIHRPAPLGRVTILVVAKESQGQGIGRLLLKAAEDWMREKACQLVEVTSNDRLAEAHAFYRHMGYERTSIRFFKKL